MFAWFTTSDSQDPPAVVATPVGGDSITVANLEALVIHLGRLESKVQEQQSKLDAFTWKQDTRDINKYNIYEEYCAIVVDYTESDIFHDPVFYPVAVQDTKLLFFEFSGSGKGVIKSTNCSQMIFVVDGNTSLELRCQKYPAKARMYQVILQSRGGLDAGDIPEPEPEPELEHEALPRP